MFEYTAPLIEGTVLVRLNTPFLHERPVYAEEQSKPKRLGNRHGMLLIIYYSVIIETVSE